MASVDYATIIGVAIHDFDAILNSLHNKSVTSNGTLVPLSTTTDSYEKIATSAYSSLIDNELFRVDGVTSTSNIVAPSGVIANYKNLTVSATTKTFNYVDSSNNALTSGSGIRPANIDITLSGLNAGYYDSNSKISAAFATSDATLSGAAVIANAQLTTSTTKYTVFPSIEKILGSLTIDRGSATVTMPSSGITYNLVESNTTDVTPTSVSGNLVTLSGGAVSVDDQSKVTDYYITVDSTAALGTSSISAKPTTAFTPGYIVAADVSSPSSATVIAPTADAANVQKRYYITAGSISNVSGTGSITLSKDTSLQTGTSSTDGYAVTASSAPIDITGTIVPGYLDSKATLSGTATLADTTIYIKKGSVANSTLTITPTVSSTDVNISATGTTYSINISADPVTATGTITPGYIVGTSYSATGNLTSKTLTIPKASISAKTALTSIALSSGTAALSTTSSTDYSIPITTSATATNTVSGTAGYVKTITDVSSSGISSAAGTTWYLKAGSVTYGHSFTATLHDSTGDGSAKNTDDISTDGSTTIGAILLSTAPTSGDYIQLVSGSTVSAVTGYLSNAINATPTDTKYMPKATFSYTQGGTTESTFLTVKTPGYIPSGIVGSIAEIVNGSGTDDDPDYADVQVALNTLVNSAASNILQTTGDTTDYQLNITGRTVNSGYFSDTNGTLALSSTYYIKHGSATITPTLNDVAFTNSDFSTFDTTSNKYIIGATVSGSVSKTGFTEGYMKAADVTVSTSAPTSTGSFEVAKASLNVTDAGTTVLNGTATGFTASSSTTSYYVSPTISGVSITGGVATAGYAPSDLKSAALTTLTTTINKVYIPAGSIGTITGEGHQTLSSNFSSTIPGAYTITAAAGSIAVSGSSVAGYIPAQTVNGTATLTATTMSVAHAAITRGTVFDSLNIVPSSSLVTYSESAKTTALAGDSTKIFYDIDATATAHDTLSLGSEGYIKSTDLGSNVSATLSSTNKVYIQAYNLTTENYTSGETTESVYPWSNLFNDSNDVVIKNVADLYFKNDVKLTLGASAAGSTVVSDLTALQQRLNGTLGVTVS